ncbi:MAG TPA: serine protease [bacterium]|nr:serine protease [bacterium]
MRGIAGLVALGLLAGAGVGPAAPVPRAHASAVSQGVVRTGGPLPAAITAVVVVPVVPETPVPVVAPRPPHGPDPAVFQLVTMTRANGTYHSVTAGTAFFVDSDGNALTNSHVVYAAYKDPAHYQLLAIIGDEFYSAATVCASVLADAPVNRPVPVPLGRDVAQIRVIPSVFEFDRIRDPRAGVIYLAHRSTLPRFASLTLGSAPSVGEAVRVVGYGETESPTVADEQWTATGAVSSLATAEDGTPIFEIVSENRPRPGNSGSPVLDDQGHVVGIYTWNVAESATVGAAIASAALAPACP